MKKSSNISFDKLKNIPLQHETLKLRYDIFKLLGESNKFSLKRNISYKQIESIKTFFKLKPFKLCNTDKNVGWVILDKELYNNLADNHLNSNNKTYNELDHNPLKLTITKVNSCLTELNRTGDISNRLFSQLLSKDDSKLGKFRILIKLHKVKLGVRPIINSINHPTSKLSHFIDLFLQPYVKESNSYIKDSQNLIQDCNDLRLDNTTNLFSCDFESLYTNINSNQAIEQICIFFQTKLNNQFDFSIKGLYEILKLILSITFFPLITNFLYNSMVWQWVPNVGQL